MKKIDLERSVQLIASLGVVAGIIFLALELQQNNKLLQAEAIGVVLEARMNRNEELYRNGDLAELLGKLGQPGGLTTVEMSRLQAFYARTFLSWQRDYFLFREGILPEEFIRANFSTMKGAFRPRAPSFGPREHWEGRLSDDGWRENATVGFREFIEQCIFVNCETIPR